MWRAYVKKGEIAYFKFTIENVYQLFPNLSFDFWNECHIINGIMYRIWKYCFESM